MEYNINILPDDSAKHLRLPFNGKLNLTTNVINKTIDISATI